jgi:hypothetical protein
MKRNYFIFLLFVVQMANAQFLTQKVDLSEPKYDRFKFSSSQELDFDESFIDKKNSNQY